MAQQLGLIRQGGPFAGPPSGPSMGQQLAAGQQPAPPPPQDWVGGALRRVGQGVEAGTEGIMGLLGVDDSPTGDPADTSGWNMGGQLLGAASPFFQKARFLTLPRQSVARAEALASSRAEFDTLMRAKYGARGWGMVKAQQGGELLRREWQSFTMGVPLEAPLPHGGVPGLPKARKAARQTAAARVIAESPTVSIPPSEAHPTSLTVTKLPLGAAEGSATAIHDPREVLSEGPRASNSPHARLRPGPLRNDPATASPADPLWPTDEPVPTPGPPDMRPRLRRPPEKTAAKRPPSEATPTQVTVTKVRPGAAAGAENAWPQHPSAKTGKGRQLDGETGAMPSGALNEWMLRRGGRRTER